MEKPDFNKNPFTSGNGATSDKEHKDRTAMTTCRPKRCSVSASKPFAT